MPSTSRALVRVCAGPPARSMRRMTARPGRPLTEAIDLPSGEKTGLVAGPSVASVPGIGFASRSEKRRRYLASLNHPHIAAIYGFEESGAGRALVLELVEGPTLADRIGQGPMPVGAAPRVQSAPDVQGRRRTLRASLSARPRVRACCHAPDIPHPSHPRQSARRSHTGRGASRASLPWLSVGTVGIIRGEGQRLPLDDQSYNMYK